MIIAFAKGGIAHASVSLLVVGLREVLGCSFPWYGMERLTYETAGFRVVDGWLFLHVASSLRQIRLIKEAVVEGEYLDLSSGRFSLLHEIARYFPSVSLIADA